MEVSWNRGTPPVIIHFNRIVHEINHQQIVSTSWDPGCANNLYSIEGADGKRGDRARPQRSMAKDPRVWYLLGFDAQGWTQKTVTLMMVLNVFECWFLYEYCCLFFLYIYIILSIYNIIYRVLYMASGWYIRIYIYIHTRIIYIYIVIVWYWWWCFYILSAVWCPISVLVRRWDCVSFPEAGCFLS